MIVMSDLLRNRIYLTRFNGPNGYPYNALPVNTSHTITVHLSSSPPTLVRYCSLWEKDKDSTDTLCSFNLWIIALS
jgi:hypothetical protein